MLLAQLDHFHFKQHIYGERRAVRGRDGEKEWWAAGKEEKLKLQEERREKQDERREEGRGESGRRGATREQWEMNIKQL